WTPTTGSTSRNGQLKSRRQPPQQATPASRKLTAACSGPTSSAQALDPDRSMRTAWSA
ncbi:MAG: hypothetical protein AVDCRST_MAG44-53, partial [uncultured Sphingomonas sp.]